MSTENTSSVLDRLVGAIRSTLALAWGLLLLVPFPYRAAIVLAVAVLLLKWVFHTALPPLIRLVLTASRLGLFLLGNLAVLPLGKLSLFERRHGDRATVWPLAYTCGEAMNSAVSWWETASARLCKLFARPRRLPAWWALLVGAFVLVSWNVGPCISQGQMANRLEHGASWWASLEGWVQTGQWTPHGRPDQTEDPACLRTGITTSGRPLR